jgi:hypothetical protein
MRWFYSLALWALIAAATTLALWPRVFEGLFVFDEGFIATGGLLITRGALPIRDFYVIYGPGQYYWTAAVLWLLGEDLYWTRAAYLCQLVLLCLVVAQCAAAVVPSWRRPGALVCAGAFVLICGVLLPSPGYAAVPAVALLLGAALCFGRWVLTARPRALFGASLLVALSGTFRWDFALYGFVALTVAAAAFACLRGGPLPRVAAALVAAAAPGAMVLLAAFAPFVVLAGASRWFDEVPWFLSMEYGRWRNLEFVRPNLEALMQAAHKAHFVGVLRQAALLCIGAASMVIPLAALLLACKRLRRALPDSPGGPDALALLLAILGLLLCIQWRVRSGFPQAFPALVVAIPLAAYLVSSLFGAGVLTTRRRRWVLGALLVPALLLSGYFWLDGFRAARERTVEILGLTRASHIRISNSAASREHWQAYVALVQHVQRESAPGEAIFSGVVDTSRLVANDAMLYFLADRPAATRWIEMEPGLTNTAAGQRELIWSLERHQVRLIVLWNYLSNEPNATARSNGVHLFSEFVAANYEESARFGGYRVLRRREDLRP